MSVEATAAIGRTDVGRLDDRSIRVLRYATGATLATGVALAIDWRLSYLTPVLALTFLASTKPRLTLKAGLSFITVVAIACIAGLLLSRYFMSYPLVYVPLAGLVLFRIFYAKETGTSPLLIIWLLIAVLVIPMVGMQSQFLAKVIAQSILVGAAATILLVWIMYALVPSPPDVMSNDAPAVARGGAGPVKTRSEMVRAAGVTTLVVFPVMVAFYLFEWVGGVLIMVFVALLSIQPGFAGSFKAGKALIVGNVIGGLVAMLFYELLVMAPVFHFMLLVTLALGLVFGSQVFSGRPAGALYGMAYSTVLLVIGSTTSSYGEAGAKVSTRVIQIVIAVVYVVVAFGLVERIRAGEHD